MIFRQFSIWPWRHWMQWILTMLNQKMDPICWSVDVFSALIFSKWIQTYATDWNWILLVSSGSYLLKLGPVKFIDCYCGFWTGAAVEPANPYIGREAWFIATLIGAIGSLVWLALCILGIFIYRRCRRCRRFNKASNLAGPAFSDLI